MSFRSRALIKRIAADLAIVVNPDNRWPCYPVLSLTKIDGSCRDSEATGFIVAGEQSKPVVYLCPIAVVSSITDGLQAKFGRIPSLGETLTCLPQKRYPSPDAMLRDYRVD